MHVGYIFGRGGAVVSGNSLTLIACSQNDSSKGGGTGACYVFQRTGVFIDVCARLCTLPCIYNRTRTDIALYSVPCARANIQW